MAHIHEKIDFTTDVFIVFKDRVLLRRHEKYGIWLGVGGHVELHEDPTAAAVREVREEVGLTVTIHGRTERHVWEGERTELPVPFALNMHPVDATHTHISFVYYATSDSDAVVPENADDEWIWLTAEDLARRTDINADIRHYATEALELLATR